MANPNSFNSSMFPAQARLDATYMKSVNTSQSLADLGITLPANAIGVEVFCEGAAALRFATKNAPADAGSGGIAQYGVFSFWDTLDNLNNLHFYTGTATNVSFFIYTNGND